MAVHLAPAGPPAVHALAAAVSAAKGGDPLAPVTVLAPGGVPTVTLRRALGRVGGGVANVQVTTAAGYAGRLAEGLGAVPLPAGVWEEATRQALAAQPGPFAAVASHPSTVERVAAALRRLRPVPAHDRAALAAGDAGGRQAHLVALLSAVESATSRWADGPALAALAARALTAGPVPPAPVVAYAPRPGDRGAVALLAALSGLGRLDVVVPLVGDPAADRPALELAARFGPLPAAPGAPPPRPGLVRVAPDAETEARLAVRDLLDGLEHHHPSELAVCPRGGPVAGARLAELLDLAGIPWSGRPAALLAATVPARTLLGVLALDDEGWSLPAVRRVLGSGPLRRRLGHPAGGEEAGAVPAARWGALARQANVVGGRRQWSARLGRLADAERRRRPDRAAEIDELRTWVEALQQALHPDPGPSTWAAWAGWAEHLLVLALGPPDPADADRAATVDAVRGLADLDGLGGRPDPVAARRALERALDRPAPRRGPVGTGVLVADPHELAGATPALLLVTGLVEGAAPARVADDPLLPDAPAAGGPSAAERRIEERAAVLAALAGAGRAVASTHRADNQAERRPSRWMLEWAGRLAGLPEGVPLSSGELLSGASGAGHGWLQVVPSFAAAITAGPGPGATPQEDALASLAAWWAGGHPLESHPLLATAPELARSVACARARRSRRFTAWDGLLERTLPLDGPVAATALERWAECPRRHLLQDVLGVTAADDPADQLEVDGAARGGLAHRALHAVVSRRLAGGRPPRPDEPWDELDLATLRRALHDGAEGLRAEGHLGTGTLADLRLDELDAALHEALAADDAFRAADGWVPAGSEVPFDDVAVALPGLGEVRFRGRMDRVDLSADGRRARVLDYKTGQGRKQLDARRHGPAAARLLQLAVYERAAQQLHPAVDEVTSAWWLVERGDSPLVPNALTPDLFEAALSAIVGGIRGGVFPADPGEDRGGTGWSTCRFCPYDRVCPADRHEAIERKLTDPELAPFVALRRVGDQTAAAGEA